MKIVSINPLTEKYITGQMSDGSDRQVVEITEYTVIVEVALQRYVATLNESEDQHIIDAFNGGMFTPVPKATGQRVEELEAENTALKLALAELAETQEADKLATQLALAELAELMAGGE